MAERRLIAMEVRQFIRPDITASVIAHALVLALVLLFTEVHPFGTVTAEPIAVDLVTPEEMAKKPEPDPQPQPPSPDMALPPQPVAPAEAAPAQPKQPSVRPDRPDAAAQQSSSPPSATAPAATPPSAPAPYTPPEPDLTVKYHVMLGLPEASPPSSDSGDKLGDGVDARDSGSADLSSSLVAAFRRHLKTCSKLPATVAPSDSVMIKLRVVMTPQARLATEPILIEGTASEKGLELKRSAVNALAACQPYQMLPANRYGEWKILDLTFTPRDFAT